LNMDHTSSAPFCKGFIEYVLEKGGGYFPCPPAFDLKGWAILNDKSLDTVSGWVTERNIPYRLMGKAKFVTFEDFWNGMPVFNAPEPNPGKGGKKRGD
jgi:hypothetical protein